MDLTCQIFIYRTFFDLLQLFFYIFPHNYSQKFLMVKNMLLEVDKRTNLRACLDDCIQNHIEFMG